MPDWVIYHNPRCSKSRQALQLLRERGVEPEIVLYLDQPPPPEELDRLLRLLGLEPLELMRWKEAPFAALSLGDGTHTRDELIRAMAEHPILIERPIVVHQDRAVLGRPPERVLELL